MAPKPTKPQEAFRENVCDKKRGLLATLFRVNVLNTVVFRFMVDAGLGKPCLQACAGVKKADRLCGRHPRKSRAGPQSSSRLGVL